MELDITDFYTYAQPEEYAASVAEIGENAGSITWHNACNADFNLLNTDDKRQAFRDYIKGFGAWDDEEIAAFTCTELNALCVQMIAGDIRERLELAETWAEYQALSEAGTLSGRLFEAEGKVYYSLD
jgi:hypothetical protein